MESRLAGPDHQRHVSSVARLHARARVQTCRAATGCSSVSIETTCPAVCGRSMESCVTTRCRTRDGGRRGQPCHEVRSREGTDAVGGGRHATTPCAPRRRDARVGCRRRDARGLRECVSRSEKSRGSRPNPSRVFRRRPRGDAVRAAWCRRSSAFPARRRACGREHHRSRRRRARRDGSRPIRTERPWDGRPPLPRRRRRKRPRDAGRRGRSGPR